MTPSSNQIITLNGFHIDFSVNSECIVRDLPDSADIKTERDRLGAYWFTHWSRGKLYQFRRINGGPNIKGDPVEVDTTKHAWLLRSLLDDSISAAFEKYDPLRIRPFTFLAQRTELVGQAAKTSNIIHKLLPRIKVIPKFSLQAKQIEMDEGNLSIGLFLNVGMRYSIEADLTDLQAAGVNLAGMYLVRRNPKENQRRLVGRFSSLDDGQVTLSESFDEKIISKNDVQIEGSLANFSQCLKTILGRKQIQFSRALEDEQSRYRLGPEFDEIVEKMGNYLRAKSPIKLAEGVDANVGERVVLENTSGSQHLYQAKPVAYVFDRSLGKQSQMAWKGLSEFGPYDRGSFANKSPRVLVVHPKLMTGKLEVFLHSLREGIPSYTTRQFRQGMVNLMGLASLDFVFCPVAIGASEREDGYKKYRDTIEAHLERDSKFDAAIVGFLDEHAFLPGVQNPYIQSKALLLTLGIPSQGIRNHTLNQSAYSLPYTLQNFSISLYAKLNGTPWTIEHDQAINDEIILGMGIAELSGSRMESRQRFVGITTVFSGDGNYIVGNVSKECAYEAYGEVVRHSMAETLQQVKSRNNWQKGDAIRIIFHAHKPLKKQEIASIVLDCTREIGEELELQTAFLTISHDHPFMMTDSSELGVPVKANSVEKKGVRAPRRGLIARIGRNTRLLAVNSHNLIKWKNTPLPKPLLVSLHPDSTFEDVDYLTEQVLKFTGLSWRSTLPAGTPATVFYSERMASILGQMKQVPNWSSSALNIKLRWSRWFL